MDASIAIHVPFLTAVVWTSIFELGYLAALLVFVATVYAYCTANE